MIALSVAFCCYRIDFAGMDMTLEEEACRKLCDCDDALLNMTRASSPCNQIIKNLKSSVLSKYEFIW